MFIDTHAHLFASQFDKDREEAIERAKKSGIERIYLPNIDLNSVKPMIELEESHPELCKATIGLHPCSVKEDYSEVLDQMERMLETREFSGIGETGIDLYWDDTTKDIQLASFRRQIDWAKNTGLPIIIHSRDSLETTMSEISRAQDGRLKGIFHCFTGTVQQAEEIKDMGFHLGIGGVLTFKNSGLDKVIKKTGIDKLVLETDAPYLAPAPHRGKRNEPAYVSIVGKKLAEILDMDIEEVSRKTTESALIVFN